MGVTKSGYAAIAASGEIFAAGERSRRLSSTASAAFVAGIFLPAYTELITDR
ncbi:MAG: hypothetical protein M3017_09700 [Actinomycetota bacterium]|nr:hypothetical protein [Actinomycetota bacterium]